MGGMPVESGRGRGQIYAKTSRMGEWKLEEGS